MDFKKHFETYVKKNKSGKPEMIKSDSLNNFLSKAKEHLDCRYQIISKNKKPELQVLENYDIKGFLGYDIGDYENIGQLAKASEIINEFLTYNGSKRVLEVGIGTGMLLSFIANYSPKIQFYGIDFSKIMSMEAKRKIEYMKLKNVQIIQTSENSIPFSDNMFDLVYQCRPHKPNSKMIKEKHRVMKCGAISLDIKFPEITETGITPFEGWVPWERKEPGNYKKRLVKTLFTDFDTGSEDLVFVLSRQKA